MRNSRQAVRSLQANPRESLDDEVIAQEKESGQHDQKNDFIWLLITGVLILLTTALTVAIIKRLWTGASDFAATVGTLFTLLLTVSPFSKRGQAFVQWLLGQVPFFTLRYRGEAMAAMATVAFILVLLVMQFGVPRLATYYNDRGLEALNNDDITTAQRYYEFAVRLDPDHVIPYYNLADAYVQAGQPDEAIHWYKQAIAHDSSFGPVYARLSMIYNEQASFQLAKQTALAGLQLEEKLTVGKNKTSEEQAIDLVARYNLLSNLGWACLGLGEYDHAQEVLTKAIELEPELRNLAQSQADESKFLGALPHYYLALVYEKLDKPVEAMAHWQDSARYLGDGWDDWDRYTVVQQKLNQP